MKTLNSAKTLLTAALLSACFALPAWADAKHCGETELGEVMEDMKKDLKAYVEAFKADDEAKMQEQVDKLIAASAKSRDLIPLKLKKMDEGKAAGGKEAEKMDHAQMDHSQMGHDMHGMSHETHGEHMKYMQGMDKLSQLLKDLKAAKDKSVKKDLLSKIKKHSKSGHKAFRMKCDD